MLTLFSIDVLVVCPASQRSLLSHFLSSAVELPSLRITIHTMDDEESMGTADVLREISSSIQVCIAAFPPVTQTDYVLRRTLLSFRVISFRHPI